LKQLHTDSPSLGTSMPTTDFQLNRETFSRIVEFFYVFIPIWRNFIQHDGQQFHASFIRRISKMFWLFSDLAIWKIAISWLYPDWYYDRSDYNWSRLCYISGTHVVQYTSFFSSFFEMPVQNQCQVKAAFLEGTKCEKSALLVEIGKPFKWWPLVI